MAAEAKSYDFLMPPTQSGDMGMLGHYRVIAELGKGGMGFVFRAEDVKLKRAVALKVMNQKIAATPHSRRRFISEARAMAAVHHDNVVTIFEVGERNNTPFMAMEMLKGTTLETFNRGGDRLNFEQIIDYARQMAQGLAAAYAKGIVHRDIKPANIWIEEGTNRIKILDFGLALASTPVDQLAGRGAVIGTPGYLSPEQARSEPLDDRTDLYSMGVVLYELCTGQLPIQAKSVHGQLISILAHRPTPIGELNPEIPQPLCDLVHRMLRKEPRSRPSSAAKLAEDLDRVEQECHAKSEVAQAINKLQAGLSEVVNKSSTEAFFDTVAEVPEVQDTIPDPLADVPDPLAAPAPVVMSPPTRPAPKAQAAAATPPAWLQYWPIAAIAAVVLLALPIMTFMFSGSGRGDTAYLVTDEGEGDVSPDEQYVAGPDNSALSAKPAPQSQSAQSSQQPSQTNRGDNQQKKQRNNRNKQGGQNKKKQSQNPGTQPGNPASDGSERPAGRTTGNTLAASVASVPGTNSAPPATPTAPNPKTSSDPKPPATDSKPTAAEPTESPTPQQPLVWTTITAREGQGADAMVQSGSSQKNGLKPSLGIAARNGIETNHSYVRFDLKKIRDVKEYTRDAGIVLTLVGGRDEPIGSVIRVHGIPDLGIWPEQALNWKNSYSPKGLDSLVLLGETTISEETIVREGGKIEVRMSGPEFAKFVAQSKKEMITIVLSGSGPGSELLRFVSRESQSNRPPKLLVHVPKEPPEGKKKNRGSNVGGSGFGPSRR